MDNKYTATLYCNNQKLITRSGDNFRKIRVSLLVLLEESITGAYGMITDNDDGSIVQKYRKAVID